jgi:putative transposase
LALNGRVSDPHSKIKQLSDFCCQHKGESVMAAMDSFTVSTATCRALHCFFVINHGRRRVLHFNATEHPTNEWIMQQIRAAFAEPTAPRYLIFDRDSKYEGEATEMLKSLGSKPIRTDYRGPWQNRIGER